MTKALVRRKISKNFNYIVQGEIAEFNVNLEGQYSVNIANHISEVGVNVFYNSDEIYSGEFPRSEDSLEEVVQAVVEAVNKHTPADEELESKLESKFESDAE